MGLSLPDAMAPVANYVPFVAAGGLVHISGQISKSGDRLITGRLGEDLDLERGQDAARACALNLIAQMKAAAGGELARVRLVRLGGFVQATADAHGPLIPQIVNGASDLMVEVFGARGRHARAAVSAPALPLDAAVEIDAIIALD